MKMAEEMKNELRKFGETTAIKGVSRALKAQSKVVKLFWVLSLAACFSVMLFQSITVIRDYYKYNVITSSRTAQMTYPNFPAITICNLFPVSGFDQLQERYTKYVELIDFVRSQGAEKEKQSLWLWDYLKLPINFKANLPLLSDPNSGEFLFLVVRAYFTAWDRTRLEVDNFDTVNVSPLQKCKTITHKGIVDSMYAVLFVDAFFSQPFYAYSPYIGSQFSSGVKVMIHPEDVKPNSDDAILVPPGTEFKIVVKQSNITRLPSPYGNCTDRKLIYPEEPDSLPYDQATCISLCRQRQFIKICGCLDNYEYFTDAELKMTNYKFCVNITHAMEAISFTNNQNVSFPEEFWSQFQCSVFAPAMDECDCPVPCSEVQYELTSYGTKWPNVVYHLGFYDFIIRHFMLSPDEFSAYEKLWNQRNNRSDAEILEELKKLKLIEENFIHLNVRMNQKSVDVLREIPMISWSTMASNLGGALNLWLGIYVITVAELLELFYSLGKIMISNLYKRKQMQAQTQVQPTSLSEGESKF